MTVTSILLEHQGPFFNGVDERCSCGQLVSGGKGWAEHVASLLPSTAAPADLADPDHPAVVQALQSTCGLCRAGPGHPCVSLTAGFELHDIVHRYRVDPTRR